MSIPLLTCVLFWSCCEVKEGYSAINQAFKEITYMFFLVVVCLNIKGLAIYSWIGS